MPWHVIPKNVFAAQHCCKDCDEELMEVSIKVTGWTDLGCCKNPPWPVQSKNWTSPALLQTNWTQLCVKITPIEQDNWTAEPNDTFCIVASNWAWNRGSHSVRRWQPEERWNLVRLLWRFCIDCARSLWLSPDSSWLQYCSVRFTTLVMFWCNSSFLFFVHNSIQVRARRLLSVGWHVCRTGCSPQSWLATPLPPIRLSLRRPASPPRPYRTSSSLSWPSLGWCHPWWPWGGGLLFGSGFSADASIETHQKGALHFHATASHTFDTIDPLHEPTPKRWSAPQAQANDLWTQWINTEGGVPESAALRPRSEC